MSEWRKIKTAPKDGTVIDLFTTRTGRITDCKWEKGKWRYWGLDLFDTMGFVSVEGLITHWMPVPEDPKED